MSIDRVARSFNQHQTLQQLCLARGLAVVIALVPFELGAVADLLPPHLDGVSEGSRAHPVPLGPMQVLSPGVTAAVSDRVRESVELAGLYVADRARPPNYAPINAVPQCLLLTTDDFADSAAFEERVQTWTQRFIATCRCGRCDSHFIEHASHSAPGEACEESFCLSQGLACVSARDDRRVAAKDVVRGRGGDGARAKSRSSRSKPAQQRRA